MRDRSIVYLLVLAVLGTGAGCSKRVDEPVSTFTPAGSQPLPAPPAKLEIDDTSPGKGREATTGDTVHVEYTGTLMNGTKFDSTDDHGGEPFKFTIGNGEVIKGWDLGVVGMKVGGKRRLRIPPDLGYGENGSPPTIPANAGLIFDIELVSID
jgi:FKBP-type peptidyl-prolyl cis-trans isomerase FkpA